MVGNSQRNSTVFEQCSLEEAEILPAGMRFALPRPSQVIGVLLTADRYLQYARSGGLLSVSLVTQVIAGPYREGVIRHDLISMRQNPACLSRKHLCSCPREPSLFQMMVLQSKCELQSSASGSSSPYISSSRSSFLLRLLGLPSAALTSSSIFCVKNALISLCSSPLFDRSVLRYAVFSVTLVAEDDGRVCENVWVPDGEA